MARTRPIWVGSTAGSICSVSIGAGSLVVKRFTPTTMLSPPSMLLLRAIGGVLDLALDQARLDGRQRAAGRLDPLDAAPSPIARSDSWPPRWRRRRRRDRRCWRRRFPPR